MTTETDTNDEQHEATEQSEKVAVIDIPKRADVNFIVDDDGNKRIEVALDDFEMFHAIVDGMWENRPAELRETTEQAGEQEWYTVSVDHTDNLAGSSDITEVQVKAGSEQAAIESAKLDDCWPAEDQYDADDVEVMN